MPASRSRGRSRLGVQLRRVRTGLLAVALAATGWLVGSAALAYIESIGVFQLRRVEVRGNNILTRSEVIKAMALPLTGSIFHVDLPAVQRRVELLQYVYGVRLGRKFPHRIYIDIVENQPLAYVAAPEYFIISAEGVALPLPRGRFELELPTVTGTDSALTALSKGSIEGHGQLQRAWDLLTYIRNSFPMLYSELSEVVFGRDGEITLYMAETSTPVRLGQRDLLRRIATLDAFLNTLSGKRSLLDYAYIDLRYDRQVVVRERA